MRPAPFLRYEDNRAPPPPTTAAATVADKTFQTTAAEALFLHTANGRGRRRTRARTRDGACSSAPVRRTKTEKEEPEDSGGVTTLNTPRQVTLLLMNLSSRDKLHSLFRREFATDRAVPLSSATAYTRQDQIDQVNTAVDIA